MVISGCRLCVSVEVFMFMWCVSLFGVSGLSLFIWVSSEYCVILRLVSVRCWL